MKQTSGLSIIQTSAAWIAIIFPFLIIGGKGTAEAGIMASIVLLLVHTAITRDLKFLKERWVIAAGVLWLYLVVRSLFAPDIKHALAKSSLFIRFILFAICLEFVVSKDKKVSHKIFIALCLALIFLILDGFLQFFTGHDLFGKPKTGSNRLTGPFSKPILGTAIASFGIIAVAGLIPLLKKTTKHLFNILFSAVAIFIIVFLVGERAALLRFIISITLLCLGMFLKCKDTKTKKYICMISFAVFLLFSISVGIISLLNTAVADRQIVSSVHEVTNHQSSSYLFLWTTGLKAGLSNILFGVGPNHFEFFCGAHPHPTMNWCGNERLMYMHPHNIWIELFAEAGLIGVALFSILLYELAKKLITFCKTRPDFFACALVIGVGLAAFQRLLPLPSSGFFKNWYAIPIWFALGWMLCIIRTNRIHKL
jgi:O-antigen ligase